MSEGPVVVLVLERENAIKHWRDVMGATNPEKAAEGTIREHFAKNIERNAVHDSARARNSRGGHSVLLQPLGIDLEIAGP